MAHIEITTDGFLKINGGKKTFSVWLNGYYHQPPWVPGADPGAAKDYTFWLGSQPTKYQTNDIYSNWISKLPAFEDANMLTLIPTQNALQMLTDSNNPKDSSAFFGYLHRDEPDGDTSSVSDLISINNNIRARDPASNGHPIMIINYAYMWKYKDACDMIAWDKYAWGPQLSENGSTYDRPNALYAYEERSLNAAFSNYNAGQFHSVEEFGKPVHAIVQGNWKDIPAVQLFTPTKAEIKAQMWTAITWGCQGIGIWGWHILAWEDPGIGNAATAAQPKRAEYLAITKEIAFLNDILVMDVLGKSYGCQLAGSWMGNHTHPAVTVPGIEKSLRLPWGNTIVTNKLNWILKGESGTPKYLIVVNKDPLAVNNISFTVNGLKVTRTISTIGHETTGSGRPRTLQMTNGTFTDSFDPRAVHVYDLGNGSIPVTHKACVNNVCTVVDGAGTDECTTIGASCGTPPTYHKACVNGICTLVTGSGTDECQTIGQTCGTTQSHKECIDGICTSVLGPGTDECTTIGTSCGCVPNPQCENPLNGYMNDGCGNRWQDAACNPIGNGLFSVTTYPVSGARIYLDNADSGAITPVILSVPAGSHFVRISLTGYQDITDTITLNPGGSIMKTYTLVSTTTNAGTNVGTIAVLVLGAAAMGTLLKR